MSKPFMEKFAEWQRLYAISEEVPSPRPDDYPEMLAEAEAQRELIKIPVDDLASLRAKVSLPMLGWDGPSQEQWDYLRADIEKLCDRFEASA